MQRGTGACASTPVFLFTDFVPVSVARVLGFKGFELGKLVRKGVRTPSLVWWCDL